MEYNREKQKKNQNKTHLYVFKLIVQVLVGVWYLTFNKASAFAKPRISECVIQCFVHVCSWLRGKKARFRAPSAGERIKVALKEKKKVPANEGMVCPLFKMHKTRVGVCVSETTRGSSCSRMTFSHSSKRVIGATTKRSYVGEHKGSGARPGNIFTS